MVQPLLLLIHDKNLSISKCIEQAAGKRCAQHSVPHTWWSQLGLQYTLQTATERVSDVWTQDRKIKSSDMRMIPFLWLFLAMWAQLWKWNSLGKWWRPPKQNATDAIDPECLWIAFASIVMACILFRCCVFGFAFSISFAYVVRVCLCMCVVWMCRPTCFPQKSIWYMNRCWTSTTPFIVVWIRVTASKKQHGEHLVAWCGIASTISTATSSQGSIIYALASSVQSVCMKCLLPNTHCSLIMAAKKWSANFHPSCYISNRKTIICTRFVELVRTPPFLSLSLFVGIASVRLFRWLLIPNEFRWIVQIDRYLEQIFAN